MNKDEFMKKIWKEMKRSLLNWVSVPEFIGRATEKHEKTIVVSTMSRPKFEWDTSQMQV